MSKTAINKAELLRQTGLGHEFEPVDTDEAGVKAERRLTHPLELLYRRKAIDREQYSAGDQFRRFYEAADGDPTAMNYDGVPAPETYQSRDLAEFKIRAAISVGWLRRQLDAKDFGIVENVCGRGLLPRFQTERHRTKYQGVLEHILDKVATLYGMK